MAEQTGSSISPVTRGVQRPKKAASLYKQTHLKSGSVACARMCARVCTGACICDLFYFFIAGREKRERERREEREREKRKKKEKENQILNRTSSQTSHNRLSKYIHSVIAKRGSNLRTVKERNAKQTCQREAETVIHQVGERKNRRSNEQRKKHSSGTSVKAYRLAGISSLPCPHTSAHQLHPVRCVDEVEGGGG